MRNYAFFSKDSCHLGESYQSLCGYLDICPLLEQFHIAHMTQWEVASLTQLKVWGDPEKFHSDIAFLLVLPEEGVVGERVYCLTMMWVHPYQVRVSTIDEVVKQLTQLGPIGPNWPYALVQLNEDTHHVPLPTEGHLSVMTEGSTINVSCRKICQLEVCQLLSSGSWVVYPEGLNGCQVPVIISLPESLSKGMTMLKVESAFLQVDLSQSATKKQEPKVLSLGGGLKTTLAASPNRTFPQSGGPNQHDHGGQWTPIPGSPGHFWPSIWKFHPQKTGSLSLATSLPLKPEDSAKLVDTSSQVSIPDDAEMDNPILEEINASSSHPDGTPEPSGNALSLDVTQIQEEANKALGCLLATRSTIDACWRKEVSDFGMALYQNESEITEAIKAVKALCAWTIREAEANCAVLISEAKVQHATCIKEAEANCTHTLAEASHVQLIQQLHTKDIQHLEAEAIEEEKRDYLTFLAACGTSLRASPPKAHGIMVASFHLLLGNAPNIFSAKHSPRGIPLQQEPTPQTPHCLHQQSAQALDSVQAATQLTQPGGTSVPISNYLQSDSRGAPHSKQKEEMLLHKALSRSHQETFSRDSKLVKKARKEYYWENCPHFNKETLCNMTDIFQSMIESAGLLSSKNHEIKETWTGWSKLQYANYSLRTLPKGLKFFHPVSPLESLKVMGLTGIHHPDVLHHFNRVIHCPWCGKEGQNEGTVINHL